MEFCKEKVTFVKDMGEPNPPVFTNKCSLVTPHKCYKHLGVGLQLTCGGDRVTHDINGKDITKTWSYFIERR